MPLAAAIRSICMSPFNKVPTREGSSARLDRTPGPRRYDEGSVFEARWEEPGEVNSIKKREYLNGTLGVLDLLAHCSEHRIVLTGQHVRRGALTQWSTLWNL